MIVRPFALLLACIAATGAQATEVVVDNGGTPRLWRCGHVEMIVGGATAGAGPCSPAPAPTSASPATAALMSAKISSSTQAGRDDERRAILERELQAETSKMAKLGNGSPTESPERRAERARTQDNIEALRRELALAH